MRTNRVVVPSPCFDHDLCLSISRRVAVELYGQIAALRPDWVSADPRDDTAGMLKVVITGNGNADPAPLQPHLQTKKRLETLAERFKSPTSGFDLVIVRDMWLTGFDALALHTLYIDKPMRGHALMQAIARVNRVWGDKLGGLIVDYLGIGAELRAALAQYTARDRDQGQEAHYKRSRCRTGPTYFPPLPRTRLRHHPHARAEKPGHQDPALH